MTAAESESRAGSGLLTAFLQWPWATPPPNDPRLTGLLRAGLRIIFIFCREFQRDNIPLRASALTFTIVLSLVPILALGTAVLKGLGSGDEMRQAAYRFLDQLDSESPATPGAAAEDKMRGQQMSGHLRQATDQIFASVDRTNFSALGAFGVLGLLAAVLSVLGSIETALNWIWHAEGGRPFGRRLMDYLACMILLPLSINLAFAAGAMIQHQTFFAIINKAVPLIGQSSGALFKFLPYVLVVGTFTVLYRFLPNTRVRFGPALFGGLVGGISWIVMQTLYVTMQIDVARYNAIYGSFATIPLFLLWLYSAWIVFLAGAEAAFVIQVWRQYDWRQEEASPLGLLSLAFQVLEVMDRDHQGRRLSSPGTVAAALGALRHQEVAEVLARLEEGGLVRRVEGGGFVLAAPLAEIRAEEVVALLWGRPTELTHALAGRVMDGVLAGIGRRTVGLLDDSARLMK